MNSGPGQKVGGQFLWVAAALKYDTETLLSQMLRNRFFDFVLDVQPPAVSHNVRKTAHKGSVFLRTSDENSASESVPLSEKFGRLLFTRRVGSCTHTVTAGETTRPNPK